MPKYYIYECPRCGNNYDSDSRIAEFNCPACLQSDGPFNPGVSVPCQYMGVLIVDDEDEDELQPQPSTEIINPFASGMSMDLDDVKLEEKSNVFDASEILSRARIIEVGGGAGSLTKHFLTQNPNLIGNFVATDYSSIDSGALSLLDGTGIQAVGGVDANRLDEYISPGTLSLIISANCYDYGLCYSSLKYDWRFIEQAMRCLHYGGSLVMLLRSNALYWLLKSKLLPMTNGQLKTHNSLSCGVKQRSLPTTNRFGPCTLKHLTILADKYNLLIGITPVIPPKNVEFLAFADKRNSNQEILHGFNVQITLTKMPRVPEFIPRVEFWNIQPLWDINFLKLVIPHLLTDMTIENPLVKREMIDGLYVEPIGHDGHCLFAAVGRIVGRDVQYLRDLVASHYLRPENIMHLPQEHQDENRPELYADAIRNMHRNILWGGEQEIQVLSLELGQRIIVHERDELPRTYNGIAGGVDADANDERPAIHIFFNGEEGEQNTHYDALLSDD